jgi:hypothetical protein
MTTQAEMEIIIALPIFFLGSLTSDPLFVIVVNPLNASMPSAVAPRKLPTYPHQH